MAEVDAYRWIADPPQSMLAVAACVTVVRGAGVAGTVSAFGGDPSVRPEPFRALVEAGASLDLAAIGAVDDVVLAIEPNGWEGSRPEVLRRASASGAAVSVYWNVNMLTRFSYAVEGEVITAFELLAPEQRSGADPDRLLQQMQGLPFGLEAPIPAGLVLAERVIGRALGREDIEGVVDAWMLVPHLPDLFPILIEYHSLRYHDADLVRLVAGAGPEVQRDLAVMAAERAAEASGLDGDLRVREALAGLRASPGRPLSPEVAELVRQLLHRSSTAQKAHAGNALYAATNPDALSAALDALNSARYVVGDGLLTQARAMCR